MLTPGPSDGTPHVMDLPSMVMGPEELSRQEAMDFIQHLLHGGKDKDAHPPDDDDDDAVLEQWATFDGTQLAAKHRATARRKSGTVSDDEHSVPDVVQPDELLRTAISRLHKPDAPPALEFVLGHG